MVSKKIGLPKTRITDWVNSPYDFAFRSNNLTLWFKWQQTEDNVTALHEQIFRAVACLSQLWQPQSLSFQLAPFEYSLPDMAQVKFFSATGSIDQPELITQNLRETLAIELGKLNNDHPDQTWAIENAGPASDGWLRIGVPKGTKLEDDWYFVTEDGNCPADYEVRPAGRLGKVDTIWVALCDASSGSDLSIFVESLGDVEIRLTLGASVYNPASDPRYRGIILHDASLGLWQNLNQDLLNFVLDQLKISGWLMR